MKLVALFLFLSFSSYLVPVSAEGRVEHQKLNQEAALLPPGWVFGVQLDFACHKKRGVTRVMPHWFNYWFVLSFDVMNRFLPIWFNTQIGQILLTLFWVKVSTARVIKFFSSESSWTPKTQSNDSRAAVWLSFWFSTRPSADRVTNNTYWMTIIETHPL